MKTTIKAKVVFDSDKYQSVYSADTDKKMLTLEKMKQVINKKKCDIEMIAGELGSDNEPTLIITQQ